MYKMLSVSILCFISSLSPSLAVTSIYRNRETSFDDIKSIDSLVSSGLPLFSNGFFINTASGPVLVKSKDENELKKPLLNPGYYSTLPRVIPEGLEGLAISHFNLGTAIPAQEPIYHQAQNRAAQVQYSSESTAPEIYRHQPLPQQPLQQQQYLRQISQQEQEPVQERQERFLTQQSQQRFFTQQSPSPQRVSPQERQQRFLSQQSQQRQRFLPQRPQQTTYSGPVAQDTFQLDNFLSLGNLGNMPTSYQNQKQEFRQTPFPSRTLVRNPTVEQTLALEDELPEALRNPFYKNEQLASALAQESLPVEGEEVVGEWDTTKIQKIKIMELLRGAGFI